MEVQFRDHDAGNVKNRAEAMRLDFPPGHGLRPMRQKLEEELEQVEVVRSQIFHTRKPVGHYAPHVLNLWGEKLSPAARQRN
jgi:hypothetical protein